jgi:nucleotide-binding universal stress UspA family protein
MKNILVPTDFSEQAENAILAAVDIARKINGQITLLHVVEQPSSSSFHVSGETFQGGDWEDNLYVLKLIEKTKIDIAKAVQKIEDQGVRAKCELRIGNTFHGIRSIIAEQQAFMIVMGTQGHSALEEMFVGSNTEKVIRHAGCPVLTIKHKPVSKEYKNIIFPVSINREEKQTTVVTRDLQKAFDAVLHLVWINTPANFQDDGKSMEMLEKFAAEKDFKNFSLSIYNDYSVEEGILNFAEFKNADMIAMMTSRHSSFVRVLGGGIRRAVGRNTATPVLTWLVD